MTQHLQNTDTSPKEEAGRGLTYNPDVLNCIANLSNDEVFTPPELANKMLDLLPQELFRSPKTTFLDPFTKSGVFLREIVKRLDRGLEQQIPDRQKRIDHIMHHQVFGMACTELTSLLARRSVYCSKYANGKYSISKFDTPEGNILYKNIKHTWVNGKCKYCGASQSVYDRGAEAEQYAYMFIHTDNPKQFFKNMKFDVIVGNPPYQLSKATEKTENNGAFASAIYPLFIEQACKLAPEYICMISPSRWMTKAGQGVSDDWVEKMIHSNHFIEVQDFLDSNECFSGVDIMGGVNYFLYSQKYTGKCHYVLHQYEKVSERNDYLDSVGAGIVIRDSNAMSIIEKIIAIEGEYFNKSSFYDIVSPKHFFDKNELLSSNWKGYSKHKDGFRTVKFYLNKRLEECGYGWIKESDIPKGKEALPLNKVYIPKANGSTGENSVVLGTPFYGEPNSVCSYTYLCIGYNPKKHNFSKIECENIITYIKTRFFRYMVSIKKKTQDASRDVYQFVPLQDFSHPWTDEMLYKKYGLTDDEIAFIESMIRPME